MLYQTLRERFMRAVGNETASMNVPLLVGTILIGITLVVALFGFRDKIVALFTREGNQLDNIMNSNGLS